MLKLEKIPVFRKIRGGVKAVGGGILVGVKPVTRWTLEGTWAQSSFQKILKICFIFTGTWSKRIVRRSSLKRTCLRTKKLFWNASYKYTYSYTYSYGLSSSDLGLYHIYSKIMSKVPSNIQNIIQTQLLLLLSAFFLYSTFQWEEP